MLAHKAGRPLQLPAVLLPVSLLAMLAGCASHVSPQDAAAFNQQYAAGNFAAAANTAVQAGRIDAGGKSDNMIWSLQAGAAFLDASNPKRSIASLNNTEALMAHDDLHSLDAATDYDFATYDWVMTNTYKAIAYLAEGDPAGARVEFNRAEDRQKHAAQRFADQINEAKTEMAKKSADDGPNMDTTWASAQATPEYRNEQSAIAKFATYAPFVNPFTTYMHALFLVSDPDGGSDVSTGLNYLQRVRAMVGPNPTIDADVRWADAVSRGRKQPHMIWLVFENGQSPTLHEWQMAVPLIVPSGSLIPTMTIAMPGLTFNGAADRFLTADAGGAPAQTYLVGSFDSVMASEFNKRMPLVLTRALLEASIKTAAAYAAAQTNNPLLQLAVGIGAQISSADTRSWTALPKDFQAARLEVPRDGKITIRNSSGAEIGTVQVPADRNSVIYVRQQSPGGRPSIQLLPL